MSKECEKVIDYLNNQLTEKEKKEFEDHMQTCADCRSEVEELQQLTSDLPFSSEPVDPPEGMKDRVLSRVFEEEQEEEHPVSVLSLEEHRNLDAKAERPRQKWVISGLTAALALSILGNLYTFVNTDEEEIAEPDPPAFVDGIDTVSERVKLQGASEATATAAIIKQNNQGLLTIQAEDLSQLEGDEVYQVWLINRDGTPYRAGTFVANQNGEGAVAYSLTALPQDVEWETVAISKEPDATSQAPRGEVILSSKL